MRKGLCLGLLWGLMAAAPAAQAELQLNELRPYLAARTIMLDAQLHLNDDTDRLARALLRGAVWLEIQVTLHREGNWLPDQQLGQLTLVRRLSYEPQQTLYHVSELNYDKQRDFPTLAGALAHLLRLQALPVVRLDHLPQEPPTHGEIQARLYANTVPMTLPALDWRTEKIRWLLP